MATRRGSFRIIGGQWRGRRLDFLDDGSVRPSADRVRETLFNWAMPVVRGARCLDLFAGSGALGLEALSRGAAEVVFVDRQAEVVRRIEQHLQLLGAQATCRQMDAQAFLDSTVQKFDLVFIDPPFGQGLIPRFLPQLLPHLASGSHLYIEAEREYALELPEGLELLKRKTAGQVGYHWLTYTG